ncbi:MAG: T9SS type A sorting domain-containing protein [Bacteroidia bacterium]|jgi:hypothetical protein
MKNRLIVCLTVFSGMGATAQTGFTYKVSDHQSPPAVTVNFSDARADYEPTLVLLKSAAPLPQTATRLHKAQLDQQRIKFKNEPDVNRSMNSMGKKSSSPAPQVLDDFFGNVSQGTPNDNDIAISNSGKFIISATNTNYNIYNDTGKFLMGRTLATIANQLGTLNRTFDPRIIYDPLHDRFVAVFLQGSTSADTRIIVGFTQTEDPTKVWKFYAIPGNLWGDASWSDYPIISLTQQELFITVNRVKDNTPWQTGFIESLIWQVELNGGYAGDSLHQRVYEDIQYNGKSIWSVCPAKGGSQLYGPNQYFISMRPSDLNNDTVFLHEVTNTIASGNAQLKTTILKSDVAYGLPPNAIQPSGELLQTNDARSLCAMYEDDQIQFVGNCMYQPSFSPGFYHGIISHVTTTPVLKGRVMGYDTMDVGYPSMAYAGSQGDNNSAMITLSYVSKNSFPGTLALFVDRNLEYSDPVIVKTGLSNINMLGDTLERWGDYTGIQRRYNELGIFYLNGSYGSGSNNLTWIGKVRSTDPRLGLNKQNGSAAIATVYPNPAKSFAHIEFTLKNAERLQFNLLDQQGRLVSRLLEDNAKAGLNRFSIATDDLSEGIYFIQLIYENNTKETHKLVVAH